MTSANLLGTVLFKDMGIKLSFVVNIILMLCISTARRMYAQTENSRPILIISSYNPDSYSTSTNISEFIEEYNRLGGRSRVHIENMNCRSFPESLRWKERMQSTLDKYQDENRPDIVILLGQEAWASYLSQSAAATADISVFIAMASRNAIILPENDTVPLSEWMPESVDFVEGPSATRVEGGYLYEYDVKSNIRLIKKLYPDTENIVFISDNTYGGVSLQAFVRKEMRTFPELSLTLLDGRTHTIYTIVEELSKLPPNTALLLGTWRVDQNDGYFMQNATYSMMNAAGDIPVFSLTSLGLGYWAIGGYIPAYRDIGKALAAQVAAMQLSGTSEGKPMLITNHLKIDDQKREVLGIHQDIFPKETEFTNIKSTFYGTYRSEIWAIMLIFAGLSTGLIIVLVLLGRTRRMKDSLMVSEAELRSAKDRAEESNRMKSAFLANMSHEIRTPLNAIVGFSNILATRDPSFKTRQTCAENILNSSELLLRLINDILDLSKLEAERMEFTWKACDIVHVLYRVISVMEQNKTNGNRYVFRPKRDSFILCTDETRLQQVLINLLANAAKFTKEGTITLDFAVDRNEDLVTFAVADTGCGIPPDKRDAVFGRFEKLNTFAQGTGLGLSICRQITAHWGGEIWVDPEYDEGARFIFTHPTHILPTVRTDV